MEEAVAGGAAMEAGVAEGGEAGGVHWSRLEEERNRSYRAEGKLTIVTVGAVEERVVVLAVFGKGRSCWSWWLLRLLRLLLLGPR